jgi:hypothetical protein
VYDLKFDGCGAFYVMELLRRGGDILVHGISSFLNAYWNCHWSLIHEGKMVVIGLLSLKWT